MAESNPFVMPKGWEAVIGLEVHAQLKTESNLFSSAPHAFGAGPNTQTTEVDVGLPGVLPVMNKRAVEYSIMVGLALGCKIARRTKWDRKSYYYPDLPKNYQISQYDLPLCHDGHFRLDGEPASAGGSEARRVVLARLVDAVDLLPEGARPVGLLTVGRGSDRQQSGNGEDDERACSQSHGGTLSHV